MPSWSNAIRISHRSWQPNWQAADNKRYKRQQGWIGENLLLAGRSIPCGNTGRFYFMKQMAAIFVQPAPQCLEKSVLFSLNLS
jgi:hypothetical protein